MLHACLLSMFCCLNHELCGEHGQQAALPSAQPSLAGGICPAPGPTMPDPARLPLVAVRSTSAPDSQVTHKVQALPAMAAFAQLADNPL